jgi:hypothetical protein
MNLLFLILISGFGGGAIRMLVFLSGIVGLLAAIAFIIGYAGGDFLDGMYKILLKKTK